MSVITAMRLGIFSDVHANYEALSSVMEAYRSENIDTFYCLGDTVGYGGSPNECTDIVRKISAGTILGNHDAAVAGRMDYSYYYEAARHALDTHAAMVTEESMRWLREPDDGSHAESAPAEIPASFVPQAREARRGRELREKDWR